MTMIPKQTIALFKGVKDTTAMKEHEVEWNRIVDVFSKHKPHRSKEHSQVYMFAKLKEPRTRSASNVISLSAIVLDFDGNTDIDFLLNDQRVVPYEWLAVTTHSHTKNDQRFRVVIPLKEHVSAETYRRCKDALVEYFTDCDPASFNLGQAFYMPSCKIGSDDKWARHNKGKVFDFSIIEALQDTFDMKREADAAERKARQTQLGSRPDPTLEDARFLLTMIDAEMDRTSWLKIGSILKKTFGEDACDLFIEWSQTANYSDNTTAKLLTTWNSLRDDLSPTYGTLVFLAREGEPL